MRLPKTKCVWPMKINMICTVLVTIQRQFINVQYRDTSKVENMVRIGV